MSFAEKQTVTFPTTAYYGTEGYAPKYIPKLATDCDG